MPIVPDLRHRAWNLANNSIDYINKINSILYEGMTNKPEILPLEVKEEEIDNIKISYIKSLVDIAISNQEKLKNCNKFLTYIYEKHSELKNIANKL